MKKFSEFPLCLNGLRTQHNVCADEGSDPSLLWLWYRPAAAAPIPPLAQELPYATSVAVKRKKFFFSTHKLDVIPFPRILFSNLILDRMLVKILKSS